VTVLLGLHNPPHSWHPYLLFLVLKG
jgi:hypothetical protein